MKLLYIITALIIPSINSIYNTKISAHMITLSLIAYYTDTQPISKWTCYACQFYKNVSDIKIFSIKHQQVFILYSKSIDSIIVSFRGTVTSVKNLKKDLKLNLKNYPYCKNCKVHNGFYRSLKILLNTKLITQLINLKKKYSQSAVYITGHSMGASIAQLFALQIERRGINSIIYTFAQPRTGNKQYSSYFNTKIQQSYRIIYNNDIIPHFPLRQLGYMHTKNQIWYKPDLSYKQCSGQDNNCINKIAGNKLSGIDHLVKSYVKINRNLTNKEIDSIKI